MEDFRDLVDKNEEKAIRAISREPFTEVLYYWKKTGKPSSKFRVYNVGIKEAVSKDRYTIPVLKYVRFYPEFEQAVYDGLLKLFLKSTITLVYKKQEPVLYMCRRVGIVQTVAYKELSKLIDQDIDDNMYIQHTIKGENKKVRIGLSGKVLRMLKFLKKLRNKLSNIKTRLDY